jgi:hypothetical protein
MNPFTTHTQQQGVTYVEHLYFAMGIAYRLFISMLAFAAHALLPFIDIKPEHDLEATIAYLNERNDWIESAKTTVYSKVNTDFLPVNQREIKI